MTPETKTILRELSYPVTIGIAAGLLIYFLPKPWAFMFLSLVWMCLMGVGIFIVRKTYKELLQVVELRKDWEGMIKELKDQIHGQYPKDPKDPTIQ